MKTRQKDSRSFHTISWKVLCASLLCLLLAVIPINPASAVLQVLNLKLSGDMPDTGSVGGRDLSPDGSWVVFTADLETDGIKELYSVPTQGGEPVKISGAMVENGKVNSFEISPDSQWVVYLADQDIDQVIELYCAPIDGSAPPHKLNTPIVPAGEAVVVVFFEISPDSGIVAYLVETDGGERDGPVQRRYRGRDPAAACQPGVWRGRADHGRTDHPRQHAGDLFN